MVSLTLCRFFGPPCTLGYMLCWYFYYYYSYSVVCIAIELHTNNLFNERIFYTITYSFVMW